MKLIHLNIKRECVLVELARYVAHFEYACGSDGIYLQWHDGQIDEFEGCIGEHGQIKLSDNPRDSFKRLGKFTDLKEEDFEGLVHTDEVYDPIRFPWGEGIVYKNYNSHTWGWSAKESFISVIQAEGWYTENPYEKTCNKNMGDALSYIQAQEKVIDLSNCYLFVKS